MSVTLGSPSVSVTSTFERVHVRLLAEKTVKVGFVDNCILKDNICVAQNGAETLVFNGIGGSDFSGATEITFDVWESISGASVISKSLTGGGITIGSDTSFQLDLTAVETGAMTPGSKYYEVWVVTTGPKPYPVGKGVFKVEDTRKFD